MSLFKQKHADASYAVALSSQGVGGSTRMAHRVGSLLVLKNKIITAVNSYKTSPRLIRFYEYPHWHAEAACIFRAGLDNCAGGMIYVSRIRKNGTLGSARPCVECQAVIELARIKRVVYSNDNGEYEVM